ncbi:hypothetical protein ACQPZF_05930 [Actinosynnema sp. CS-041913]|uniref:hypothetical protein n=1 Tax=Actinosynnema sp. CS-041913 TaxID=3239917 RepID=UPI003D8D0B39
MSTRSRLLWAAAALVLVVSAVVVLSRLNEPDLIPVDPSAGDVTIAGRLSVEPATPAAGGKVVVRATISADRVVVLPRLAVRVRDEAGTFHDFPELVDVELGTAPREVESSRRFPAPGSYTYYLAYQLDGGWVDLPPWQRFTVR